MLQCDETKLQCENCVRFGLPCDFLPPPERKEWVSRSTVAAPGVRRGRGRPRADWSRWVADCGDQTPRPADDRHPVQSSRAAAEVVQAPSPSPSPSSSSSSSSLGLSVGDLELLHHYTTVTSTTVGDARLWRDEAPRLGREHPCNFHATLSLAGYHLARLRPGDSRRYLRLAEDHYAAAARDATRMLPRLDEGNCQALYIVTVLICFTAFARGPSEGDLLLVAREGCVPWVSLLRGVRLVLETIGSASEKERLGHKMSTHLAAVSVAQGRPLEVRSRPTPKPGPGELLLAVKSVALNPADTLMRGTGLFIQAYPTVIGLDVAGVVLEVGDGVPTEPTADGVFFRPGVTRAVAYSGAVWQACDPDYGVFQERCLVPWQHAAPLPEGSGSLEWQGAATLPVSVQVPLSAWDALGLEYAGTGATKAKREALLIWGASSSVGTMGVQLARLQKNAGGSGIGAVYATAGAANLAYVKSLGADRVFDHQSPEVVDLIVAAAREDGLAIRHCFLGMGDIAPCQAVLSAFAKTEVVVAGGGAKITSAPIVPPDTKEVEGVEIIFVMPSSDKTERLAQFRKWMAQLSKYVAAGDIKPSPEPKLVGTSLDAINSGLDMLSQGVSCSKLVIQIAE
ncbi:Alcohol dehydrogenase superfamily, zinc-containing [Cordyceps fumosorosea ARSEF 2679]|uniref:Alcohol dehydrogenase superfamily, zinc-containing n=1 Tax=Cordyceps fumosorosea (strain ARSEF 2679) TaxID=1081104 RepID=A0A167MS86_CORFA|nr:Alcohol dehydrogenase superfamily, zinc-containing [Cordyceps fumosorosea ARSEF 2679]OAA54697.1 Alcohol dehydrogenase superfamily, zinc-containing [Cordyceps fumosorosea ARSEF 2679]